MLAAAAATGLLSVTGGAAHADAGAAGAAANSPGVASGNTVQAPVHVPVNLCGNTVNIIGLLNPAFGNKCANVGDGGAKAEGAATHSPGVASGNVVQAPVHVPLNACGNTVDVVGILNPAFGNECVNTDGKPPKEQPPTEQPPTEQPPTEEPPAEEPPAEEPPTGRDKPKEEQARTGAEQIGTAAALSAALLGGGLLLVRRGRSARR